MLIILHISSPFNELNSELQREYSNIHNLMYYVNPESYQLKRLLCIFMCAQILFKVQTSKIIFQVSLGIIEKVIHLRCKSFIFHIYDR